MELIQKKIFHYRYFKIDQTGIHVKIKTPNEVNEWFTKFEEIGFKKVYNSNPNVVNRIVGSAFGLISLITIVVYFFNPEIIGERLLLISVLGFGIMAAIVFFIDQRNDIYLVDGSQKLVFFRNIPDNETVEKFIDLIIFSAKEYLKLKYTKIDVDLSEEVQISNYYWLREKEIISDEELVQLKQELKTLKLL